MDHVTENAIAGISPETSEVTPQESAQALQDKHDAFIMDLTSLSSKYGMNILFAVNYSEENQTAVDYIGESNQLIELGLRRVLEKN